MAPGSPDCPSVGGHPCPIIERTSAIPDAERGQLANWPLADSEAEDAAWSVLQTRVGLAADGAEVASTSQRDTSRRYCQHFPVVAVALVTFDNGRAVELTFGFDR